MLRVPSWALSFISATGGNPSPHPPPRPPPRPPRGPTRHTHYCKDKKEETVQIHTHRSGTKGIVGKG